MHATRRAFLVQVGAATALAGLPAGIAAAAAQRAPDFGFSFDDAFFRTGYATREEAIDAARSFSTGAFQTAEVTPLNLHYPDGLSELAAEHLLNAGRLGNDMVDWLTGVNEDGDFEGEFSDACNSRDRSALGDAGRLALARALDRAGASGIATAIRTGADLPADIPEPVIDAVAADAALSVDLHAALVAWVAAEDLERELRGLQVEAVEAHQTEGLGLAA